ncbi:hypothetical protein N7488_009720 [Penicillium malachiteum]|nr:hypothetical protein N7488_009720 [Penicillium malachiteum]
MPVSPSAVRGDCWFPLFKDCVVAGSFPVPERGEEIGVEIQFDIMVTLARVSYFLELSPSGRVLKGHSTMLIPTPGTTDDTIQWHFIQSDSQDLYLSTDCIPSDLDILDLDIDELRKRRSFVGYCNRAQIIAGTKESCYEFVQQSQAGRDHKFVQIGREISSTMGTGGMGIFGAGLATKITLAKGLFATVQAEEARLENRLLNSNDSPALLYDVGKKTGFIVPELNVCLQILHVWASRQADRDEILAKIPFIPETITGNGVALQAVMSNKQLLLREGYADEKPLYFMSKLKEIFLSLEKKKEQRRIFNESSIRMGAPYLRGWEFIDIAACRPSREKGIRLPFLALSHHPADSCYKIIRDNPDMVVLFSEGMADAIKPFQEQVCRAWDPLPRDRYLILASLKCLKTLSRRNGGSQNQLKLTKKLFMSTPTTVDTFEACRKGQNAGYSHVYCMSKPPDESLCLDENGAVILGEPKLSRTITGGDGRQVTFYCLDGS